jgi:hypothetical protein
MGEPLGGLLRSFDGHGIDEWDMLQEKEPRLLYRLLGGGDIRHPDDVARWRRRDDGRCPDQREKTEEHSRSKHTVHHPHHKPLREAQSNPATCCP